jgi:hypothetical protein
LPGWRGNKLRERVRDAMLFFKQFEIFDPVSGEVPSHPFAYMPAIASRARAILKCGADYGGDWGCKAKITLIAERINQELDQYFDDIKYMEIERLREQAGLLESMGGDPEWPPNEDDLEIQTWVNANEVDALKSVLENRDSHLFYSKDPLPKPDEYREGKDYELFAVLSLWMMADAQRYLNASKHGLSIAGEYALKAMDAVCYAEHLREAEWLVTYAEKLGDDKLIEALKNHKSEIQKQKTERSKELNLARHQKTYEAKVMVVEEFMKNHNKFLSAEKAGNHFADWLRDKGILNSATGEAYEPRTVAGWIRTHFKEIGKRWR